MTRRRDERGHWYLLTGLLLGLAAGLVYAWVVQPVEYVDTSPASLRSDFKDQHRALIAAAYAFNGDLVRAEARLKLLGDKDLIRTLSEQAQRSLAQDSASSEARALGLLAIAIGQGSGAPANPALETPNATTPPTPTNPPPPTFTPTLLPSPTQAPTDTPLPPSPTTPGDLPLPTDTPTPTRSPSATPGGPFVLDSRQPVCDSKLSQPLIIIEASNAAGQPVAGVLVIVTLVGGSGEERFYTGLKPEKGLGYADFIPAPGKTYTLRLGEAGELVSNLVALECKDASGDIFWGALVLRFVQK